MLHLVTRARNDLTIVDGESDGQDILGVAVKLAGGATSVQVPQAEGAIPRGGKGELAIRGDDHVLQENVRYVPELAGYDYLSRLR
jgi:hypothetical protein